MSVDKDDSRKPCTAAASETPSSSPVRREGAWPQLPGSLLRPCLEGTQAKTEAGPALASV